MEANNLLVNWANQIAMLSNDDALLLTNHLCW